MLFGLFLLCCASTVTASIPNLDAWSKAVVNNVHPGAVVDGITIHGVDYDGMAASSDRLEFLKSLSTTDPSAWSENATYAVLGNAYNALAMTMVLSHPCIRFSNGTCRQIRSINDISNATHNVFDLPAGVVANQEVSLNDIELWLRVHSTKPAPFPAFRENCLVHANIVCASVSCPNVHLSAFMPSNVSAQYEANMRDMLSNTKKGALLDRENKTLTLSKIFYWYSADFAGCNGGKGVLAFIMPYLPADYQAFLATNTVTLQYFDYDWNVNGSPPTCNC